jgi:hypothetical protein
MGLKLTVSAVVKSGSIGLKNKALQTMETYTLNEMEKAFMDSYMRCVSIGNRDDVVYFLANKDNATEAVVDLTYTWPTIEDAWLMWRDAMNYAKKIEL